jgi:alpha-glucosidase
MVLGKNNFGIFIDYPSEISFDFGFSRSDILEISVSSHNFYLYFIKADAPLKIVNSYLNLFDKPYVPPKWAFGYQQSRWSYPTREKVEEIAETFRSKEIPCDAIYLDLDYMEDYKIFTADDGRFPNFKNFAGSMFEKGFKLVPIIDPGVKTQKGYYVYDEGLRRNVFCKDENGENFVGAVWPGWVNFPDFLNPSVREWWGKLYQKFVDMGIISFWNDMNEPSIFYTPKSLNKVIEKTENIKKLPGIRALIEISKLQEEFHGEDIYKNFYHFVDGKRINHNDVHNLYGFFMAKATAEGLKKLSGKRYFLLSRSSYSGAHTFTGIWTGDNKSWWEHLELNIYMLMSLNMLGFFYSGADIGGFGDNVSSELLIRWNQLGVFSPLFRNHSAIDTRYQEPWAFDERTEKIIKKTIELRYILLSHIYSEFMKAVGNKTPLIKPLFFDFDDDDNVYEVEDQFMFGDSLMIAPIYKPNSRKRFVYLPGTEWMLCKISNDLTIDSKIFSPGFHFVNVPLDDIPIFLKKDSLIILNKPMNYVGERKIEHLKVVGFVDKEAEFIYYDDNGEDFSFKEGNFLEMIIKVRNTGNSYDAELEIKGNYRNALGFVNFEIYDLCGKIHKFTKQLTRREYD